LNQEIMKLYKKVNKKGRWNNMKNILLRIFLVAVIVLVLFVPTLTFLLICNVITEKLFLGLLLTVFALLGVSCSILNFIRWKLNSMVDWKEK
jgi:hypothetical protein